MHKAILEYTATRISESSYALYENVRKHYKVLELFIVNYLNICNLRTKSCEAIAKMNK